MPRQDLPLNPGRMLRIGEVPDPVSDAANVPRAVPQSIGGTVRPGTPIEVISKASTTFNIPGKQSDRWFMYNGNNPKKRSGF